jgi:hypothetical protein
LSIVRKGRDEELAVIQATGLYSGISVGLHRPSL